MFAKVVIDLKTDQLNESYDYQIPFELENFIGIGSRVSVPFGLQNLMGYVIDIMNDSPHKDHIKFIKDVLDYEQELTKEQIELAQYLCSTYAVSMSSVLDKMIPSFLKGQQRKYIVVKNYNDLHPSLALLFMGKERIMIDDKIKKEYNLIRKEIEKDNISLDYDYYTYGKNKKQKVYYLPSFAYPIARSNKRKKIIDYIKECNDKNNEYVLEEDIITQTDCTVALLHSMVKDKELLVKEETIIKKDVLESKQIISNYQFSFDQSQTILKYDQSKTIPYLLFSNDEKFNLNFYLHIIEENTKQNKITMICAPTVMLQEEMYYTLKKITKGYQIFGLNAKKSQKEFYDCFMGIRYQTCDVFVTTMAGILLPFKENSIGTIIVLEEDNANYINENYPYFHLHEIVKYRANYHNARLIFATSTPSIETYQKVEEGKYNLYRSDHFIVNPVYVVSLKEELEINKSRMLSHTLISSMQAAFDHHNQVMLYLNNKGYASILQCKECGKVLKCPTCQIPLTLHKEKKVAKCPYCDYKLYQYDTCSCGSHSMMFFKAGLEQLKEELTEYFPDKKILQVDADQMKSSQDYEDAIASIDEGTVDIIIGTNILTKHFSSNIIDNANDVKNIEVIGLLSIDDILNSCDYRAREYVYNTIAKNLNKSKVIIQTFYPNQSTIQKAILGKYDEYYNEEIKIRKNLVYPPFCEMNRIMITGDYKEMYHFANYYKKVFSRTVDGSALGPVYDVKSKGVKLILKHNDFSKVIKILDDTKSVFKDINILVSFERIPKVM